MNVKTLLQQASQELSGSETPQLDAQLLLGQVLNKDRTWLMTWNDQAVEDLDEQLFLELIHRRRKGEPIAYILGHREFWNLDLDCNRSTLIPRPETEHLIETTLTLLLPEDARVLDLGTGTGAIALALASEKSTWQIDAVDCSEDAVTLAQRNQTKNRLTNLRFFQSDWFQRIDPSCRYDLIVSNPPYVDPDSEYLDLGDVRFEPRSALIAEKAGIADLEHIIQRAPKYLKTDGWLVLEHGFDQEKVVQDCLLENHYVEIRTCQDLAGLPRVSYAKLDKTKPVDKPI